MCVLSKCKHGYANAFIQATAHFQECEMICLLSIVSLSPQSNII